MVGKSDMTLHGWKQLIEWSLQHACMSQAEYEDVYKHWEDAWDEFLHWMEKKYGGSEEDEKLSPL